MTFVSVTRLRLRSLRFVLPFALRTRRTIAQVRSADGFLEGSLLNDRDWTFWTMTLWQDASAMRAYMLNGDHREAMPMLAVWCDQASVAHWQQDGDALPHWSEGARRMRAEGRASNVQRPAPDHTGLGFAEPRLSRHAKIVRR